MGLSSIGQFAPNGLQLSISKQVISIFTWIIQIFVQPEGGARSDEPTPNYHLTLQFHSALYKVSFRVFQLIVLILWPTTLFLVHCHHPYRCYFQPQPAGSCFRQKKKAEINPLNAMLSTKRETDRVTSSRLRMGSDTAHRRVISCICITWVSPLPCLFWRLAAALNLFIPMGDVNMSADYDRMILSPHSQQNKYWNPFFTSRISFEYSNTKMAF